MPDYNDLNEKLERAVQLLLLSANTGHAAEAILTTFSDDSETQVADYIMINTVGGLEEGFNTGSERLSVNIRILSSADRREVDQQTEAAGLPRQRHSAYTAKVIDALKQSPTLLAQTMNQLMANHGIPFHIYPTITYRRAPGRVVNRKFISEFSIEGSCCPTAIA